MKPVAYHRLADNELAESAAFYEHRREFLGEAFLDAVDETLAKIQNNSALGHPGKFGRGVGRRNDFRSASFIWSSRIESGLWRSPT
jgi:hypothetical protein